jgi:hypothetical protein
MSAVNAVGLSEIREFLATHHKRDEPFTLENLRAWARDAEFQMSEGNPPSIEIRAFDTLSGRAEQYTISTAGIDVPASGMSALRELIAAAEAAGWDTDAQNAPILNAARDALPELLEALRWALDQIEDEIDPDHQAALSAARAMVDDNGGEA